MRRPGPGTRALAAAAALLVAIQFVPYGHEHSRPPDGASPPWNSQHTLALAQRACFDCHSNHTRWPWYASVAPVSWRIATHVGEGRRALNLTAFDPSRDEVAEAAGKAGRSVRSGEMPPQDYLLMHPDAGLGPAGRRSLADGLDSTFRAFLGSSDARRGDRAERRDRR